MKKYNEIKRHLFGRALMLESLAADRDMHRHAVRALLYGGEHMRGYLAALDAVSSAVSDETADALLRDAVPSLWQCLRQSAAALRNLTVFMYAASLEARAAAKFGRLYQYADDAASQQAVPDGVSTYVRYPDGGLCEVRGDTVGKEN